ncbi:hypothetical protein MRX96_024018 [Rhipicephalus microplus]
MGSAAPQWTELNFLTSSWCSFLDFGAYSSRNLPECTSLALPRSTPWVCRSRAVFRCGRRTKRQLLTPKSSAHPVLRSHFTPTGHIW